MPTYTVQIEASNADATVWQAISLSEDVQDLGTAQDVAEAVATEQNVAYDNWRVLVWEGAGADTSSVPAYTFDYAEFRDAALDNIDGHEQAGHDLDPHGA
jgi:hypothetical protein